MGNIINVPEKLISDIILSHCFIQNGLSRAYIPRRCDSTAYNTYVNLWEVQRTG